MTRKKKPVEIEIEQPPAKQVFVMDIRGVFNPLERSPGYKSAIYTGHGEHHGRFFLINPDHIRFLDEIRKNELADFAWASTWVHFPEMLSWYEEELGFEKNTVERIGVPAFEGHKFGVTYKFHDVARHVSGRAAIWVDDVWGGREPRWARERTDRGLRTSVVATMPYVGLDRRNMGTILGWLTEGK